VTYSKWSEAVIPHPFIILFLFCFNFHSSRREDELPDNPGARTCRHRGRLNNFIFFFFYFFFFFFFYSALSTLLYSSKRHWMATSAGVSTVHSCVCQLKARVGHKSLSLFQSGTTKALPMFGNGAKIVDCRSCMVTTCDLYHSAEILYT
jgi:hypothetical protein